MTYQEIRDKTVEMLQAAVDRGERLRKRAAADPLPYKPLSAFLQDVLRPSPLPLPNSGDSQ